MAEKDSWHLDRRVTVGLILSMGLQLGYFVWWASGVDSKVHDHDRRITVNEGILSRINNNGEVVGERLARLETQVQNGVASLDRIELSLRDISARQRK